MSDSVCPKCGSQRATPMGCPACGAGLAPARPFDSARTPAHSPVVSQEICLDREHLPARPLQRDGGAHQAPAMGAAGEGKWAERAPAGNRAGVPEQAPAWARHAAPLKRVADAPEPAWFLSPLRSAAAPPADDAPSPLPEGDVPAARAGTPVAPAAPSASLSQRPRSAPPMTSPAESDRCAPGQTTAPLPLPRAEAPVPSVQPMPPARAQAIPPAQDASPGSAHRQVPDSGTDSPLPARGALPAPRTSAAPATTEAAAAALQLSQQPAARAARVAPPAVEEIHAVPAGIFARGLARIIDLICLGCLTALVLLLAEIAAGVSLLNLARAKAFALPLGGLFCALTFAYAALFHALGGRTPGKWVAGICVLDETGQPPSLGRAALRALLAFASAAPLFLGFVAALFSRKRQAFHDKVAGTYVVRLIEPRRPAGPRRPA